MTVARAFLDWSRPALAAAVEYLIERFGTPGGLDLENVVLALPGARAGRRLLEILVQQAESQNLRFCPPRIVTAGQLPELLYEKKRPFAGDLVQQLAWIEALRGSDPKHVQAIVPTTPAKDDLPAWLSLGEMLGRLHRELAAEAQNFADVAQCGSQLDGFRETARWQALAAIQQQYLGTLDGLGLWDLQTARLVAIRNAECHTEKQIVLVGAADLNRSQRLMLDQVADRVTALVFAPMELADRFDEHGCLRPEAWLTAEIPLSSEQMEIVDDPAAQAEAAIRALAGFGGRYNTEQISLGVPDEQIVPYLEQQLEQAEVPARYGVGRPIARSGPYRLLAAVADYLETASFTAFAALVRHPWVHDWLAGKNCTPHAPREDGPHAEREEYEFCDWLTEMDCYHAEHMPHRLDGRWQGHPDDYRGLKQAHLAIETLCQPLRGRPRPLAQWGQPILDLLTGIFGTAPLDPEVEPDRSVLAACRAVQEVIAEHAEVPESMMPALDAMAAVRLVLRHAEGAMIPPPPDYGAIEMLGWLELPLDDAPALIVTGFNEGRVPASVNADLFLPNQLRRALGIEDNDRRYARDAYALSVLAASRKDLRLIAGRRNSEGDPQLPSRLLFACDDSTMAKRVLMFFSHEDTGHRQVPGLAASLATRVASDAAKEQIAVPRPRPLVKPITSMRVTEFRDYLACPYRYYLRHLLKLESVADSAAELDGAAFGSMAHEVLGALGTSDCSRQTDAEAIRQYLSSALDDALHRHYGAAPMAAILVQAEQLRLRLAAFAQWQAEWAGQGWRIEHVEVSPQEGTATMVVDGQPMFLRGRIDRIDVHETTGRRTIFDYKLSDRAKTPEQAHRKGGTWIDLQLPLYRHLVAGLGIEGPVDLAYIVLPKDASRTGSLPAEWSPEDLEDADRTAEEVIRRVRAEVFWPPAVPPPEFCEQFSAICQDGRFGAVIAEEELASN